MIRLATEVWVHAYIERFELQNIPTYVLAHGDNSAGAVLVKLATLDGQASLLHRTYDLQSSEQLWSELASGSEAEVDALITKQRSFDPDLWVVEIESPSGKHFLENDN